MIYWIDIRHIFQGCNFETRRSLKDMIAPKYSLKHPIFDYGKKTVIGVITFQIPNTPLASSALDSYKQAVDQKNYNNLQFVFENAPVAFWIMDRNHKFLDGNPQAFRAAGVSSLEEFKGKTLSDFTEMGDFSLQKSLIINHIDKHIFQTGIEESAIESAEHMSPYHEPTFMHQSAWAKRPIYDVHGEITGIAGVAFFNDKLTSKMKFVVPKQKRAEFLREESFPISYNN